MTLVDEEAMPSLPKPREDMVGVSNLKGRSQIANTTSHGPLYPASVPEDSGLAAPLFLTCVELCRISIIAVKKTSVVSLKHQRGLIRVAQSLFLWGQSHDILGARSDYVLQASRCLQRVTIKVLRSILSRLAHGILRAILASDVFDSVVKSRGVAQLFDQSNFVEIDEDEGNSESTSEDESSENEEEQFTVEEMITRLHKDMRCLTDLSVSLVNPAFDLDCNNETSSTSNDARIEHHRTNSNHSSSIDSKEYTSWVIQPNKHQEASSSQFCLSENISQTPLKFEDSLDIYPLKNSAQQYNLAERQSLRSTGKTRHKAHGIIISDTTPDPTTLNLTKDPPSAWISKPEVLSKNQEEALDFDAFLLQNMEPNRPDIFRLATNMGPEIQFDDESYWDRADLDAKIAKQMDEREEMSHIEKKQLVDAKLHVRERKQLKQLKVEQEKKRQQDDRGGNMVTQHKQRPKQQGPVVKEEKRHAREALAFTSIKLKDQEASVPNDSLRPPDSNITSSGSDTKRQQQELVSKTRTKNIVIICCHCGNGPCLIDHNLRCVSCNHDWCGSCEEVRV